MGFNKRLIDQGGAGAASSADYLDIQTYTGNSSSKTITTGLKPELVLLSCADDFNPLGDIHWGSGYYQNINATTRWISDGSAFTGFNSDNYTLGSSSAVNQSGISYTSYAWELGASQTDTNGDVNSTVYVSPNNATSFASYVGNNATSMTVGHGLGIQPQLVIVKNTSVNNYFWAAFGPVFGSGNYNIFQFNSGVSSGWPTTLPTTDVVTVGLDYRYSQGYNMYSFANVPGYQDIQTYTGNGGTKSITTGFEPRFVMLKKLTTSGTHYWSIFDSVTGIGTRHYLNNDLGQQTGNTTISSFDANGFTLSSDSEYNGSGTPYFYWAIA
jgi:hypothetical protein